jgi:hypothetical protein
MELHRQAVLLEAAASGLAAVRVARRQDDVDARAGQLPAHLKPDAAVRSGDDGDSLRSGHGWQLAHASAETAAPKQSFNTVVVSVPASPRFHHGMPSPRTQQGTSGNRAQQHWLTAATRQQRCAKRPTILRAGELGEMFGAANEDRVPP